MISKDLHGPQIRADFAIQLRKVEVALEKSKEKASRELIEANKDKLERIARALLKYETLDADDVKLILEGGELDKPTVGDLLAAEQAKEPQDPAPPQPQTD